jgi:hypothetical protein
MNSRKIKKTQVYYSYINFNQINISSLATQVDHTLQVKKII